MLTRIVYDVRPQISRAPSSQRCRKKNKQGTKENYDSRKPFGFRASWNEGWRDQMANRDDERRVIKYGQAKSCEVNRADDPEPFFEFKFRRTHRSEVNQELKQL